MLTAVIIDDEMPAINALQLIVERYTDTVKVVGSTTNARVGISLIEECRPDIVFLDISMPDLSGFMLLRQLKYREFNLVFTTAHENYAIQAIKYQAADYLVKPIDIEEFKQAIETVENRKRGRLLFPAEGQTRQRLTLTSRIGLPIREGLVYIVIGDIVWVESQGNYCTFYTCDAKKYIVSKNIGEYESMLPEKAFFRVHKSYLINVDMVRKYIRGDGHFVEMSNGSVIEVSRRKREEFLQFMNELHR